MAFLLGDGVQFNPEQNGGLVLRVFDTFLNLAYSFRAGGNRLHNSGSSSNSSSMKEDLS